MKTKLFILIFIVALFSCGDDFKSLNVDPINPTSVPGNTLFANGIKSLARANNSASVNLNVFRLYSQYWAQTTYPDESQYNQTGRRIPQRWWDNIYLTLNNLKGAKESIENAYFDAGEENVQKNQIAQTEIMSVYGYSLLLDTFGNIPYSESLNPSNTTPSYDDGATVHKQLLERLSEAINMIDTSASGIEAGQDYIYSGDMSKWLKFANSLKLRMALRISDKDISLAKTNAEQAISAGVFSSNDDSAMYKFIEGSPNSNPVWEALVQSGRDDFVPANTLVDYLNGKQDPRRMVLFTKIDGDYSGGEYGTANAYTGFSHIGSFFTNPALPGVLIDYSEVCFLLSEAKELNFSLTGTAEEWLRLGVKSNMEFLSVSQAEIDTYLSSITYNGIETLAYEKWVSQFNNGLEGWSILRKFDSPKLNVPDGMTEADFPTRLLYPANESALNEANYTAAGVAIGGDKKTTKLWWDVN